MPLTPAVVRIGATEMPRIEREMVTAKAHTTSRLTKRIRRKDVSMRLTSSADLLEVRVLLLMRVMARERDRKSTRLNSSNVKSSYVVFCLKKTRDTSPNAKMLV